MTLSKTDHKGTAADAKRRESAQADLQIACQIHTLVQRIYGQMAPPTPLMTQVPPAPPMFAPFGLQAPAPWMASTAPGVPHAWPVSDPWLA